MARYEVETEFVFKGIFKVEANSKLEAVNNVINHCGLVIGGNIHSSLPDDMVDWDFKVHPEKKIKNVNLIK